MGIAAINLLDKEYNDGLIKEFFTRRKIKFRLSSFEKISLLWKTWKKSALERKIEAKKENLVSMQFNEDAVTGTARKKTEEKIMKKANAIAKLESKLEFLETGNYTSEKFVNSRAIKLKEMMMNNLTYNIACKYSVTDEVADQILAGDYQQEEDVEKVLSDEMKKMGEKVAQIMQEKEEDLTVDTINGGTVASTVNKGFSEQEIISEDVIRSIIEDDDENNNNSNNTTEIPKVNKFINDDGTYRLKREDIDEEFRITRFDKKKNNEENKESNPVNNSPNITPFSTADSRTIPEVELPRRALTEIVDKKYSFPKVDEPTIVVNSGNTEKPQEQTIREVPVVVPERNNSTITAEKEPTSDIQKISEAVDKAKTKKELDPLIARVNVLRAEKDETERRREEAENRGIELDLTYQETIARLEEFADSLEHDCNINMAEVESRERENAAKEAKISAMLEMMSAGTHEVEGIRKGK